MEFSVFSYKIFMNRNGDFDSLRHELDEFGYLFIRGFHPDNLIKIARTGIFSNYFLVPNERLYLTATTVSSLSSIHVH